MVDKKNLIKEFQSVLKKPIMIEGIDKKYFITAFHEYKKK